MLPASRARIVGTRHPDGDERAARTGALPGLDQGHDLRGPYRLSSPGFSHSRPT